MPLRILHTGDFHGKLDPKRLVPLKALRSQAELYFDCGDGVSFGNLAIPTKIDPVWQRLADLSCTATVPGNRESHVLSSAHLKKLAGAAQPILCANLVDRAGKPVHQASVVVDGVGIFGVMVPMVTERMASKVISDYLWLNPIKTAKRIVAELRPKVEVLIALTHIGYPQDVALVGECPGIDLILGGHSHTLLEEPVLHGETWVAHTGSHGRFAGLYSYDSGTKTLSGSLHSLAPSG
ncbi:MAG: Trifunctional nucleotide phosphoesterase protein YfkN [Fimbriimonadaceae bacterium]|nr:Trifunctional nucleotide phosphoesterase protein YfkN [Fimbriimonadaceae bacterium]